MRGSERIHHVDVAQCRHATGKPLVVGLLAFEEAHVLAEHNLAGLDVDPVEPVLGQTNLAPEQLAETASDRRERERRVGRAFRRTPEVRHHHDPGTGFRRPPQRGHRRPEPRVARDLAAVEGDVQVLADQHPASSEIQVDH